MVKIVIDAGHGINTAGKRTPDDEREWTFNNKVAVACIDKLNTYKDVLILRVDDTTGKIDTPLVARTNQANRFNADVLVSIHHNANTGKWGSWGGVETYTQPGASKASVDIANIVNPKIVKAMGLRDRGCKTKDLHMTRESRMPAILTEGGFMDSTTDIGAMRSDARLKAQGVAIAEGLAEYFKLVSKEEVSTVNDGRYDKSGESHINGQKFVTAMKISNGEYPAKNVTREQVWTMLERMHMYWEKNR